MITRRQRPGNGVWRNTKMKKASQQRRAWHLPKGKQAIWHELRR